MIENNCNDLSLEYDYRDILCNDNSLNFSFNQDFKLKKI